MIRIVAFIFFFKIFPSWQLKTICVVKLESMKETYVNNKLVDYNINAVPYNNTINFINQTVKFKFDVTKNILMCDTSSYRITKNNRTFLLSRLTFPFKDTITMEKFNIDAIWRDYTRPALLWPPQINVKYHTYGWAPDGNKILSAIPSGDMKIEVTNRFQNRTKVFGSEWIVSINYY